MTSQDGGKKKMCGSPFLTEETDKIFKQQKKGV